MIKLQDITMFADLDKTFYRELQSSIPIENNALKILNQEALDIILETNTLQECTNCIATFKAKLALMKGK